MDYLLKLLPPELHALPVLAAGFVALLGLMLWSAGIKAARPLAAAILGATLAAVAAWLLPGFTGLGELPCGLIGLAAGLIIGALAFRALQGVILATCLGVAAAGGFYYWQGAPISKGAHGVPVAPVAAPTPVAALQEMTRQTMQTATAQWMAIPGTMRQSMIVISMGVAILALAFAWIVPRYTTWLMTAIGGTGLLLLGGFALLRIYGPQYERVIPTAPLTRLEAVVVFILVGMLVQRVFFWPGKRQKQERAKDAVA